MPISIRFVGGFARPTTISPEALTKVVSEGWTPCRQRRTFWFLYDPEMPYVFYK